MPKNARAFLVSTAILAAIMLLACSGAGTNRPSQGPVSNAPPSKKWYEGGTLHNKTALDWQVADYDDKLATCSDFVAKMWEQKNFNPKMQQSISSVDDMKPYAQELVKFLDAATKQDPDPDQNRKMYVNQTVSSMAAIGMVSMRWTK